MPKITKHGGATVYLDTESFLDSLGELATGGIVKDVIVVGESTEVETSVGDNSLKSSRQEMTISEILGIAHQ